MAATRREQGATGPAPAALSFRVIAVTVRRLCAACDRELPPGVRGICPSCEERNRFRHPKNRRRMRAAQRLAIATPWFTPPPGPYGFNNSQDRIYAEFSMPHRFDPNDV